MIPPKSTITQLLQQGQLQLQQGRPDLAEACWREILDRQPRSFEALHLLGMLKLQLGQADEAVTWLARAARHKPADSGTQTLLGIALQLSGRIGDSLEHFRRAATLAPGNPEFHYNLGKALRAAGHVEDAIISYEKTLALKADHADALNNLSEAFNSLDRAAEAAEAALGVIRLNPAHAEAWSNLGGAQLLLEQAAAALESLDHALQLRPDLPRALCNRAKALAKLGRIEEAIAFINQVAARLPASCEPIFTRGLIRFERGDMDGAMTDCREALAITPDHVPSLVYTGTIYLAMGHHEAAIAAFDQVLRHQPDHAVAHYNLGITLLLCGQFGRGWHEYGWRFRTRGFSESAPVISLPLWQGDRNVRLLVVAEQGIGDQIMYASMLGDLKGLHGDFTVALSDKLLPVFRRSFPQLRFISLLDTVGELSDWDEYIAIGSLGLYFRRDLDAFIGGRKAYLHADPARVMQLRGAVSLRNAKVVCGLSWFSNNKPVGTQKSMALSDLSRAFSGLDFNWIDLQYGDTNAERRALRDAGGLDVLREPTVDTYNDIDGLAALVDACDVIVTISNTTAHLAGALGKQVFLMLPHSAGRFWCWQAERDEALWYPNVRIFRQPREGDWASVLARVREALAALPPPAG
ncbi:MAG: tetratricopeptide repeat protein [Betaproteobacteria bacterium]|nr:tetratricopeptide repeat protein [Betaproteobacteria bacterium]